MKMRKLGLILTLALLLHHGGSALAVDFSFTGSFTHDDDVRLFNFALTAPASVTLRTFGYAGGVTASGQVIPAGGFDPILTLFDASTGDWIDESDDARGFVPADPTTGDAYDALLQRFLPSGAYVLALSQYDNFAASLNLADGFIRTGEPTFTGEDAGIPGGMFLSTSPDGSLNQRSSSWAVGITVPDNGSTVLLLGLALGGMLVVKHLPAVRGAPLTPHTRTP